MKESYEGKSAESEPYFMNNFRCYLPGGPYRGYYGNNEGKTKIMDAFDKLVAEEFTYLDINQIIADIGKGQEASSRLRMTYEPESELLSEVEEQRIIDENSAISKSVDDRLRPIFNRLIELGKIETLLLCTTSKQFCSIIDSKINYKLG